MRADDLQHTHRIGSPQGDVEGVAFSRTGSGAARRSRHRRCASVAIAAGAGVHAEPLPLGGGEALERQIVEVDEALQQATRGIELDRQPPLGEVDLDLVRALLQAPADLGLVLVEQVDDEPLARIAGKLVFGIEQAQRRGRNHRLLHRHGGVALRLLEEGVGVAGVAERTAGQAGHAPLVTGSERDPESLRAHVRQAVDAVGQEVVELALLAVGDHRRARRLEAPDRVADRVVVERVERGVGTIGLAERIEQPQRAGNAADRFGREGHAALMSERLRREPEGYALAPRRLVQSTRVPAVRREPQPKPAPIQ